MAELRYKPWGETRSAYGTTPTTFTFTGQRVESKLGLHFYNARWYDSQLGRFIQADSVVPYPYDPQSWDRFAYVRNKPISRVDPSGHADCIDGEDFCYDNQRRKWLGHMPDSWWLPVVDHKEVAEENLKETADLLGRVIYEPYDWARIGIDCLNGVCTGWDLLGLAPILPAGITKYGDDVVGLLPKPQRANYPWHHLLPQRFRDKFSRLGVSDIDNYLVSLPIEVHKNIHGGGLRGGAWNNAWYEWLENNPDATAQDIFRQVGVFIHEFNLDGIISVDLVK